MKRPLRLAAPLITAAALFGCNASKPTPKPSTTFQPATGAAASSASAAAAAQPAQPSTGPVDPASVPRIAPKLAHQKVQAGEALLVCAYDNREKCDKLSVSGSLQWADFEARLPKLGKDQKIILFCA